MPPFFCGERPRDRRERLARVPKTVFCGGTYHAGLRRHARELGMIRCGLLGLAALLAMAAGAQAQTGVERGRYLVDTVMTCHNCHTPMGPNGPQFDKALSGGLRFDEPPFDVTASNITPDFEMGIGNWKDGDIKKALLEGVRPAGHHLAEVMPS